MKISVIFPIYRTDDDHFTSVPTYGETIAPSLEKDDEKPMPAFLKSKQKCNLDEFQIVINKVNYYVGIF